MAKIMSLFFIFYLAFSMSCAIPPKRFANGQVVLDPRGETILVTTQGQRTVGGEFLFCDQQAIFVLIPPVGSFAPEIVECPYANILRLKVKTYVNKSWIVFVLGGQIIPAIALGLEAAGYSEGPDSTLGYTGKLAILGALSSLLFFASTPRQPQLAGEITLERMIDIQKFARYPYVPSLDQKKIILEGLKNQPRNY